MSTKSVREIALCEEWVHHEGTTAITFPGEVVQGSSLKDDQLVLASFHARRGDAGDERRSRARLAAAAPDLARAVIALLDAPGARSRDQARKALAKAGVQ